MNVELKKARLQLYKPTSTIYQLVDELANLITHCFGDKVEVNGLRFDSNSLKIGKLYVKMIEVNPKDIGHVMIHWYPNYKISPRLDPFCSAYIFKRRELDKLIQEITKIKDYYNSHIVIKNT